MTAQLCNSCSQGSGMSLETTQCAVQARLGLNITQLGSSRSQPEGLMTKISNCIVLEG